MNVHEPLVVVSDEALMRDQPLRPHLLPFCSGRLSGILDLLSAGGAADKDQTQR